MFDLITCVRQFSIIPLIHRPYLLKTQNPQVKEVDEKMGLMKDSNKGVNYEFLPTFDGSLTLK